MAIRLSGLSSGLDTESLVSELVSAYRTKTEKYTKAQTKLTWKQDAWSSLSAKTASFRTSISSLRFSSAYKMKTTSVSNSTKATVTAGNSAVTGSQSLNITQLAKTGYLTGGKLNVNGKSATASTKLSALTTDGSVTGDGRISVNGKEITLKANSSINDVVTQLNNAGVTASFDATNQRIFVSASSSGKDNDFTLSALDANGAQALKSLGLYTSSNTVSSMYTNYAAYAGQDTAALLQTYADNSTLVSQANSADTYLTRALNYVNAQSSVKEVEDKLGENATDDEKAAARDLMANSTKLVMADGSTFTYHKENGKEYYTDDSETVADGDEPTKYYLTVSKVTTQEAELNDDGSEKTDDDGNVIKKDVTTTTRYLSTSEALDATDPDALADAKTVQTASDYLKEKYDISASDVGKYNSATATIKSFDDDLAAELEAEAEAAQKAADAGETYTDPSREGNFTDYRSLAAVKSLIDNGITADEIKTAQTDVAAQKTTAQEAIDADSFIASYAKQYMAAKDDATRESVATQLQDDITYAVDSLAAEKDGTAGYSDGAVRVDGQDAVIYLNGAQFTSSSNTLTINGLTITALGTTISEDQIGTKAADEAALTVTTSIDSQGVYDQIKDFLSQYNSLINTMTSYYNAESTSDYEPLTDDEKEAMTDSQIEKWEEKGKSGVLRRDSTLSALMSAMTSAMSKSYTINGKSYSLSSFGIKTLGILNAEKNEQNAYHIDGDEDDDDTKSNTDKLMAAIVSDPDGVMQFFQKLTSDVYDNLGTKMTSTSMRTYGTFYNDKEMAKEYSDYTTTISKWEDKLADMEDSYYKKFAAMESALASLQSKTSALSGLLG